MPLNGKHDYSKGSKLLDIFQDLADIVSDMKPSSNDVKMRARIREDANENQEGKSGKPQHDHN